MALHSSQTWWGPSSKCPARLDSVAVAPFFWGVQLHHISSCVRSVVGAVNASWPQQTKQDKRIPALCCAYICLSVFVVGDLHCFRSGGRWLCFCCCQLEDALLWRGATMRCCRNGSQYLPLQRRLSLCFIAPRAGKKSYRSKKWHSF